MTGMDAKLFAKWAKACCRGLAILGLLLPLSTVAQAQNSLAGALQAQSEFLPVREAYRLDGAITPGGDLQLYWQITEEYYLYQHAFKVRATRTGSTARAGYPPTVRLRRTRTRGSRTSCPAATRPHSAFSTTNHACPACSAVAHSHSACSRTPPSHLSAAPTYPPNDGLPGIEPGQPNALKGRRKRRSEGAKGRSSGAAAPAALPPRLCSSSRVTADATNSGSLAPTHDFPEPQEVARIFHRAFSSTSTRTVISPPLLLSSGSHPNRLFTRTPVHRDCIIDPRSRPSAFSLAI